MCSFIQAPPQHCTHLQTLNPFLSHTTTVTHISLTLIVSAFLPSRISSFFPSFLPASLPSFLPSFVVSVQFSPDGQFLLFKGTNALDHTTPPSSHTLVDAFEGKTLFHLGGFQNSRNMVREITFSPDSRYVASGSDDGNVHVYSTSTGANVGGALCGWVDE